MQPLGAFTTFTVMSNHKETNSSEFSKVPAFNALQNEVAELLVYPGFSEDEYSRLTKFLDNELYDSLMLELQMKAFRINQIAKIIQNRPQE